MKPSSRYGQSGGEQACLLHLPEDVVGMVVGYMATPELAAAGASCRELYFATYAVSSAQFTKAFGAPPDPSMSRAKLFHAVERVGSNDETSIRDLLLWSCVRGYAPMIKRLHKRSTRLGLASSLLETRFGVAGLTPLLLAVEHNRLAVVKLLLELGADPSRGSTCGLQPSHVAGKHGLLPILRCLQGKDAGSVSATTLDGRTPLHYAAAGGHADVVEWLLGAGGVDVDAHTSMHDDVGGETGLHLACYHGHATVVAKLLHAGANPNVQLRNGRTPALLAAEMGWEEVLRLLVTRAVQYPVDLSLATDSGKSPLYCAVEKGHEGMVRLLLAAGAQPAQATRRNKIPLHCAAEKGCLPIAKALMDHEAAQHVTTVTRGRGAWAVPLFIASKTSNKQMRELLVAYTLPEGQRHRVLASLGFDMSGEEAGEWAGGGGGGRGSPRSRPRPGRPPHAPRAATTARAGTPVRGAQPPRGHFRPHDVRGEWRRGECVCLCPVSAGGGGRGRRPCPCHGAHAR